MKNFYVIAIFRLGFPVVSFFALSNCSSPAQQSGGVSASARMTSVSIDSLYQAAESVAPATRAANIQRLADTPINQLYTHLVSSVDDSTVSIGGAEFSGIRSLLMEREGAIANLNSQYKNVGGIFRALGVNANSPVSEAAFTSDLNALAANLRGHGLALQEAQPNGQQAGARASVEGSSTLEADLINGALLVGTACSSGNHPDGSTPLAGGSGAASSDADGTASAPATAPASGSGHGC